MMNIGKLINCPVCAVAPTRRRIVLTLIVVWLVWFLANLGPNALFYLALHGIPSLRIPGDILYYLGISSVGIVAALHLSRQWQLDLSLFPKKMGIGFWIGSGVFLALAIVSGVSALADAEMTLGDIWRHPPTWIIAPLVVAFVANWALNWLVSTPTRARCASRQSISLPPWESEGISCPSPA